MISMPSTSPALEIHPARGRREVFTMSTSRIGLARDVGGRLEVETHAAPTSVLMGSVTEKKEAILAHRQADAGRDSAHVGEDGSGAPCGGVNPWIASADARAGGSMKGCARAARRLRSGGSAFPWQRRRRDQRGERPTVIRPDLADDGEADLS